MNIFTIINANKSKKSIIHIKRLTVKMNLFFIVPVKRKSNLLVRNVVKIDIFS